MQSSVTALMTRHTHPYALPWAPITRLAQHHAKTYQVAQVCVAAHPCLALHRTQMDRISHCFWVSWRQLVRFDRGKVLVWSWHPPILRSIHGLHRGVWCLRICCLMMMWAKRWRCGLWLWLESLAGFYSYFYCYHIIIIIIITSTIITVTLVMHDGLVDMIYWVSI